MADSKEMGTQEWQKRLEAEIANCGKSQREVSLAAGLGPGYVHSILRENKDPTIGNLTKVCQALNISVYRVLGGFEMTPEDEELLRLLSLVDRTVKQSFLTLLRTGQPPKGNPSQSDESLDSLRPKRP